MDDPADFDVADDGALVRLTGDWTVTHLGDAAERLAERNDRRRWRDLNMSTSVGRTISRPGMPLGSVVNATRSQRATRIESNELSSCGMKM